MATGRSTVWSRFRRHRLAMIGAAVILILTLAAILAPLIAPYDPTQIDLAASHGRPQPPSLAHPFGTDEYGRDSLSRALYGARISLSVGVVSMGISITIGAVLGSVAGYFGGWLDSAIMRLVDVLMSIPTFFLILTVQAYMQPSIYNIMIVIGVFGWMGVARMVRAVFLSLRETEYVEAARAAGLPPSRIIIRHLLPNSMAPILVAGTLGMAYAILTESALSFLGLGVQPPAASWGNMLQGAQSWIRGGWWLGFYPGILISAAVLSLNFMGDGLRDALDPRLK